MKWFSVQKKGLPISNVRIKIYVVVVVILMYWNILAGELARTISYPLIYMGMARVNRIEKTKTYAKPTGKISLDFKHIYLIWSG